MDLKEIQKRDPLKRNVEKGLEGQELSPMDPPDAYTPPNMESIAYEDMHPVLQAFMDDHTSFTKELDAFETALGTMQEEGITKKVDEAIRQFFYVFDQEFIPHHRREEKELFPLLEKRLIEKGEHSKGLEPTTAVDMLEDDHLRTAQLGAVVFNFFGLACRLPDKASRAVVLDAAIEQGKSLVESMRLHIFREDQVVFTLAQRHISPREFEDLSVLS